MSNTEKLQTLINGISAMPEDNYDVGYEAGKADGITEGFAEGQAAGNALTTSILNRTVTSVPKEVLEGVASIGDYFFNGCKQLTDIDLPKSITTINQYAFNACSSLVSIDLSNIKTINGYYAFGGCTKLKSADLSSLTNKDITGHCFRGASSLESVIFPSILETIGSNAFAGCNLKSIDLPATIKSLYNACFSGNTKLETIIIRATTPPSIESTVFIQSSNIKQVIVPQGCADAYKSATNWSKYADIIIEGDF